MESHENKQDLNREYVGLLVKVFPSASVDAIIQTKDKNRIRVFLRADPKNGQANKRLKIMLAKEYSTQEKSVVVTRGHTSRNKHIHIYR